MDKFIVKKALNGEGAYYYLKNGLLHRELGPAIIDSDDRHLFNDLGDESLYEEEIIQTAFPENYNKCIVDNKKTPLMELLYITHYLEGRPYSEEEFKELKNKIELSKELNQTLLNQNKNNKKVKI